ncbi:uncharacterized protein LOC116352195 [Contarinia nasturtii]|uniref:uncharacterized protein LOC116352195 n=1 Tax=Contarinia nasturtii TaxID=265458 RepID=UPI0012D3FC28|nr:uncharacterized protein LOC116352195 [Contarinia nasturtii]
MNKVHKIRDDLTQMSPMEREKHKEALVKKLMDKDPSIHLVKPEKSSKSCAWGADCFSLIFNNNVKENYVYCQICSNLITYNSVHGTGSLLRHHCYKKVMNMQKEEKNIAKTLNFSGTAGLIAASPKIVKRTSRGNENSPLGDLMINSTETIKFQMKGRDNTKQKKEIEEMIAQGDPSIDMRAPENIKSDVWSNGNFKILYQNGKKLDFVMCLFCHSLITYKSKTGTASLLRHSCIKRLSETIKREQSPNPDDNIHEYVTIPISEEHPDDVDATQTTSGADNLSFANENDTDQEQYSPNELPMDLKEEALRLFHILNLKDMHSPSLVDNSGFLSFAQYLINVGAEYKQVSIEDLLKDIKDSANFRSTVCEKSTQDLHNMLKPKFDEHKIALSCDYWHDPNRRLNFFTLYGHYISNEFGIKKVNLRTESFAEEFTQIDYKQLVTTMLDHYFDNETDVEAFLSKTTTVVFDEMLDSFKSYSTINCSCATLNRIVFQLIDAYGLRKLLPNDIWITKDWSKVWEYLEIAEDSDEYKMNIDEFKRILDPFTKAAKSLSSDTKPTINEVYIFRKKIEDHFRNTRFSRAKIRDIALNLIREQFPVTNLHKIAVFLDPRFKSLKFMSHEEKTNVLNMVSKMISSNDENDANVIAFGEENDEKTSHASGTNKLNSASGGGGGSGGSGDTTDSTKYLIEYMDIVEERDETHDEVETYVNLKFNDISVDILEFWESRYDLPHLRQLAKEILCIPASGIVGEKIFSDKANLLAKRRLNMEIDNVKQMLHIHENFEMYAKTFVF